MYSVRQSIAHFPRRSFQRSLQTSITRLAKNDSSTIDLYKLPSQTSINEWEFRYDFAPKLVEPKVPPVSPEAVNQDIAQTKAAEVEAHIRNKEANTSMKVAGDAEVTLGGVAVDDSNPTIEPKIRGAGSKKPANRDKYLQSSTNPDINQTEVVNLSEGDVSHKTAETGQARVVDDLEHDGFHTSTGVKPKPAPETKSSGSSVAVPLGIGAVLAYFGYSWVSGKEKA